MKYFLSDYSQGAHPKIMQALMDTNMEHSDGYTNDIHCDHVREMIKEMTGRPDANIHLFVSGTPTNIITIAAALRPYEAVVAARTGHIYCHECGGVELTGHKIIPMNGVDGKLTPELIDEAWIEFEDEHTVIPRMAYITNSTELGTVYTLDELKALRAKCDEHEMFLYMDGARIGAALTSEGCDYNLKDIAQLMDAFYIGGTKNGTLLGEALVILNDKINDHFKWMMKQNCGLLAKGRLIGVQFEALLEGGDDSLFFQMARHENEMAKRLKDGIAAMGYSFSGTSTTNQIFPIFPTPMVRELEKDYMFYDWAPAGEGMRVIRLVASWGTTEEDVDEILALIKKLGNK